MTNEKLPFEEWTESIRELIKDPAKAQKIAELLVRIMERLHEEDPDAYDLLANAWREEVFDQAETTLAILKMQYPDIDLPDEGDKKP